MNTERENWLNAKELGEFAAANRFDSKALRTFYCLGVNSKLEPLIADKKFKAKNIGDMGQLFLAIAKIPTKAARIAVGAERMTPTDIDALIRLCDPYCDKRDELRIEMSIVKDELNRERSRSLRNPSYDDIENQKRKVSLISSRLGELEKEFAALPNRNTLPSDLTHPPSKEELIQQDLVTMRHPKAPKLAGTKESPIPYLTDKGKRLYDASVKLGMEVDFLLKTNAQISASLIQQFHKQIQETYRECWKS